jgi:hypothetical protein
MAYQLTEEQKKLLTPEEQSALIKTMEIFEADILKGGKSEADAMPEGKADFPPLGVKEE